MEFGKSAKGDMNQPLMEHFSISSCSPSHLSRLRMIWIIQGREALTDHYRHMNNKEDQIDEIQLS